MRYRAFISYSQRDKPIAKRLHHALETYRLPMTVNSPAGPVRRLGRFFRDDDEMGASQSLGSALEGALDDAENLIVICSPAAARSKWVDAEVRRFKRRGSARVFAVIASGEPNSADPNRECFPPSLKVRIDADGTSTGQPDEPRAPDLKQQGMQRVRIELAAGLLDISFDTLWQRDRRRARQTRLLWGTTGVLLLGLFSWLANDLLSSRRQSRAQAARDALDLARGAIADGRNSEALTRLAPFMDGSDTRELVEEPLRTMLGWLPDPYGSLKGDDFIPARLRHATVLLRPGKDLYDISDLGVNLERLIRSRDGSRIVAVGDRRVAVFEAKTGKRLAQVDNNGVDWSGYSFEAPSGLIIITGAVMGPTNGSVWPYVLSVSDNGVTAQSRVIKTRGFGGAIGVTPNCDALTVADDHAPNDWHVQKFELNADRLEEPTEVEPSPVNSASPSTDGVTALAGYGPAFESSDVFLGHAKRNPLLAAGCSEPGMDEGFVPATFGAQAGARVIALEPVLAFEKKDRWTATRAAMKPQPATYVPNCTEAQPCSIIAGRTQDTYVREDNPILMEGDQVGPPPATRWSRRNDAKDPPIYFDHRVFNSGHKLAICRHEGPTDVCFVDTRLGEDHLSLPFLRSPDGRYLFWPFGGSIFDLQTLQPMTAMGAIPTTTGMHYDFDVDRPALTVAVEGRLITFVANAKGTAWERSGEERASPIFGALSSEGNDKTLLTLASLGGRQYLAVRSDGVLARLDGVSGREVWRVTAAGLGAKGVELNPERRHALLMGKTGWRVFRLSDGLALSGLLAPPPAVEQTTKLEACRVQDVLGPGGELLVTCGDRSFAWRPRPFTGDIKRQLTRLTCAAEVSKSALDTIQRCYVTRWAN